MPLQCPSRPLQSLDNAISRPLQWPVSGGNRPGVVRGSRPAGRLGGHGDIRLCAVVKTPLQIPGIFYAFGDIRYEEHGMLRASTKGYDATRDEFHMMIGYCIAEWAGIDDELFRIFQHCTGAKEQQAAIIYYRTPGLNVRLGLVDEIVRSVLPQTQSGGRKDPKLTRWEAINKDCENLFGTRRRIAHQPVRAQETLVPMPRLQSPHYLYLDQTTNKMSQASFEIYTTEIEKMRGKDTAPLTLKDLQNHQKRTSEVRSQMNAFFAEVLKTRVSEGACEAAGDC
jgi:hypothetical protein